MTTTKLTPAAVVIERFNGVRPLARLLELNPSSVCRWQDSGLIPSCWHETLLDLAKSEGVKLTFKELVIGG